MVTKKKLTKEEWEAMTGTDMSFILPSDGSIETARESSLNDTGNSEQNQANGDAVAIMLPYAQYRLDGRCCLL